MSPSSPAFVNTSPRELLLLVPLAGVRSDLALGEFADGLLEEQLLLVQAEIQNHIPW